MDIADAVIVGGGILGAALAAALSRRLSRVVLLDAGRCGGRATGSGFAWVNASSKWQDETYHRLSAEACRVHLALASEWDASRTGWNGGGSLTWAYRSDEPGVAALESRIHRMQTLEYPIARLNRDEMRALEPDINFREDALGMFAPSEGWVSTHKLVRFYLEQARENHAQVAEFSPTTGFSRDHRGYISSVETPSGRIATRVVILCAGTESGGLAALVLGHQTELTDGLSQSHPGLLVESGESPADARIHRVCYPPVPGGFHLRPTAQNGILAGAEDIDAQYAAAFGAGATAADLARIEKSGGSTLMARAAETLPGLDSTVTGITRSCIRPVPADGLPVVGELPGVPGAFVLCAHSGVTLAPMLSPLLADEIVTGRKSPWLEPYRPARLGT